MATTEIKLNQVLCGKSEEKLKDFPNNFFDATVTDPPYGISFMGKTWDDSDKLQNRFYIVAVEMLRVAKPGSFLLCFGGTRTFHRVVCALEDAGWIIKDQIMWLYGEGFPKSTNIGKQIDKEAGVERTKVVGKYIPPDGCERHREKCKPHNWVGGGTNHGRPILEPVTELVKQWEGYGTGLKPGWEPIIVAMKPLEKGLTYAENAKKWGVAGLNIDGGRIGISNNEDTSRGLSHQQGWKQTSPAGSGSIDDSCQKGRWPANVILSHSPDCVCVGEKIINEGAPEGGYTYNDKEYQVKGFVQDCKPQAPSNRGQETVEIWACVPDCPVRIMDSQSGILIAGKSAGLSDGKARSWKNRSIAGINRIGHNDSGGASRFFYCAKAKRSEKEAGLRGFVECAKCGKFDSKTHTVIINGEKKKENCIRNTHPTVKPLDLMRYLLTLIKMPSSKESKQVILDPFCGSGTTLVAAEQLDINYIGMDQDSDSCLTSIGRIGV